MQQLNLFDAQTEHFPFERPANKREATIINEVFNGATWLTYFLKDIIDLYPYRHLVHTSCDPTNIFQVVGCCAHQQCCFYMIHVETGSLHLIHNFSTFPVIEKS